MGIIAVLLFSQGHLGGEFHVPFWVVITCQAAMGLGTLFGGWRIVHTMGSKITRLTPDAGVLRRDRRARSRCLPRPWLGVPVSTTHTITGVDRRRRRGAQGVGGALERRQQHRRWPGSSRCRPPALIGALFYVLSGLFS